MLYHPDKHKGSKQAENYFSRITFAYNQLTNILQANNYQPKEKYSDSYSSTNYGATSTGINTNQEAIQLQISLKESITGITKPIKLRWKRFSGPKKNLMVKIPPGTLDGAMLRLKKAGLTLFQNETPHDLFVLVHIKKDPRFVVDSHNIYTIYYCSKRLLKKGGLIKVKTPVNKCLLRIPQGSRENTFLRVKGFGIHNGKNSNQPGDFFVNLVLRKRFFQKIWSFLFKKKNSKQGFKNDPFWELHSMKKNVPQ